MASLAASKSAVFARPAGARAARGVAPRPAISVGRRNAVQVQAHSGAPLVGSHAPDFKAQVSGDASDEA